MIGIYGIHNTASDRWYVGQSRHIELRWQEHKNELRNNRHINTHLQRAYNKYGDEVFEWVILEECLPEELDELEIAWIAEKDGFNNGYNQTIGGGGCSGYSNPNKHPVVILNTGEQFESVLKASKEMGISKQKIRRSIKTKTSYHGYWEFLPDNFSEEMRLSLLEERKNKNKRKKEPRVNPNGYHKWSEEAKRRNKGKNGKAVIQMDLSGEYIAEYPSSVMAGEALGVNHRKIRMVCNGERKKCGGFKWKWKDENA